MLVVSVKVGILFPFKVKNILNLFSTYNSIHRELDGVE